jgi:choline kinase
MKAVLLSAGQGRRLLPLTENRPKCLIPLSGPTVLEWQVRALANAGVTEAVIVTGFGADQVDAAVRKMQVRGISLRTLYNPFYSVADNLASCWVARGEMNGPFLILNGDTLVESAIPETLLANAAAPITVTIDRKASYDADDMKVQTDGDTLLAIGKTLPLDIVTGESIGFLRFSQEGAALFVDEIERSMRDQTGLKNFYLLAIGRIAAANPGAVKVVSIEGFGWGEMDYPADFRRNEELTRGWLTRAAPIKAAAAR